jgi:hypothetical protein
MSIRVLAVIAGLVAAACSQAAPTANLFPEEARTHFMEQDCPGGGAFCDCSWDRITREFTADEWAAARASLEATGRPDPRIVIISSQCRDQTR